MKKFLATLLVFLGLTSANAQASSPLISNSQYLESFGYKTSWYMMTTEELARKNLTISALANQLKLQQQRTLSWNQGFDWQFKNYFSNRQICFITSPLHGWIYIICNISDELNLLDGIVDNYYGFTSYRVVGAVAWKIVKNGKIERYFTYADGQVYHNQGNQTLAEKQLGLVDLSGLDNDKALEKIYAEIERNEANPNYLFLYDEENPVKLCEILTGQNPLTFENFSVNEVKENGIVGFLPNN